MKKTLILIGVVAFVGVVVSASSVLAESTSTIASTTASNALKRADKLDKVTANLQARADKEIDRRISALNKLQEKIQGINKISATDKASFATTVQGQITLLNNLKIKIGADTDAATLKTDVQSVTRAYRIYALVLPQVEILAAADKLASTADLLSTYTAKLQARITTAQGAGKDVTALQSLISDMNTKIADAKTQSADAVSGVITLKPDNGDKTLMTANTTALKTARTVVNTGSKDLKDANKDGVKIRVGLKNFDKTNATSTATTTSE